MGIVTVLYLVFWTILLYYFKNSNNPHGMGEQFKSLASIMLTQMGLQFSSMLMCLLTIMLGAGSISSDLENGMIHAIISRPLKRSSYVLGKYFGLLIVVISYSTILFSLILLIGGFFSLTTITSLSILQIVKGWFLYLTVPSAVLCITLYGSVSIKTVPNGLLMIFIYILGNIGGMVEMIGKYISNPSVTSSGIFISLISPFQVLFTTTERILLPSTGIAGDLMRGSGGLSGSGSAISIWMYVYILFYSIFFVWAAISKFEKLDII